jgi:hypothetical protein
VKPKKPSAIDRLPWDATGLDLRFQKLAPNMDRGDRAALVSSCLHAFNFGLTAREAFDQVSSQLLK